MKNIIESIIIAAIAYLILAILMMDINAAHWTKEGRFATIWLAGGIFALNQVRKNL